LTTPISIGGGVSDLYVGLGTGYYYVYDQDLIDEIDSGPYICPSVTPTPSITPSVTPSKTTTPTPTLSITLSPSITPSITISVTPTITLSVTPSITPSITSTPSITRTPSITPSITPSSVDRAEIWVSDEKLKYKVLYNTYSALGAKTLLTNDFTEGHIWVLGNNLLYKDYNSDVRYIKGKNTGKITDVYDKGKIYIIGGQLKWVSTESPYYEYSIIKTVIV
jgi:hypothetical protein